MFWIGLFGSVVCGLFIFSFLYTIYKIVNKESKVIVWIIYTSIFSVSLFNIVNVIIRRL